MSLQNTNLINSTFLSRFFNINRNYILIAQLNHKLMFVDIENSKIIIIADNNKNILNIAMAKTCIAIIYVNLSDTTSSGLITIDIITIDQIKQSLYNDSVDSIEKNEEIINIADKLKWKNIIIPDGITKPKLNDNMITISNYMDDKFLIVINNSTFIYDFECEYLLDISYNPDYCDDKFVIDYENYNVICRNMPDNGSYISKIVTNPYDVTKKTYQCKKLSNFETVMFCHSSKLNKIVNVITNKDDNKKYVYIANIDEMINSEIKSYKSTDTSFNEIWTLLNIPYEDPEREFIIYTSICIDTIFIQTYKNIYYSTINVDDYKLQFANLVWNKIKVLKITESNLISDLDVKFKINILDESKLESRIYDDNLSIIWNSLYFSKNDEALFAITIDSRIFQICFDNEINELVAQELYIADLKIINDITLYRIYMSRLTIDNKYVIDIENRSETILKLENKLQEVYNIITQ